MITIHGMERSDALEAAIREHAAKLERFDAGIVSCRITVEETSKRHVQGREFSVHIDVRVPGREIVARREHDEDVFVALRESFDAARRQIEDVVRERRGAVKAHEKP